MNKNKDITGKKFGKLTAIKLDKERTTSNRSYWICQCDCGNKKSIYLYQLTSQKTKSCGCLLKHNPLKIKHGNTVNHQKDRLYSIWDAMIQRCYNNNNPRYKDYGGRNIIVYEEWKTFINFKKWAISNGYDKKLTIERINVNGNYEPDNCTWITKQKQYENKRNTKYVVYKNNEIKFLDLLEQLDIKKHYKKIIHRINDLHWKVEDAVENL